MKDQHIVASILKSIKKEVEEFVRTESEITDSLEYEEKVLALSQKFGRELINQTQGKLPKSRNSKKKS